MKKAIISLVSLFAAFSFANAQQQVNAQPAQDVQPAQPAQQQIVQKAKPEFTSALGKNYVGFGLGGGNLDAGIAGNCASLGAVLEGNINVFLSDDETFGLDINVPLKYNFLGVNEGDNYQTFNFPLNFRPFYRFVAAENFVITPYADCGFGGMYSHFNSADVEPDGINLTWKLGGGVEFSFAKNFSFAAKYSYNAIGGNYFISHYTTVGGELSWKFSFHMVASIEYGHDFYPTHFIGIDDADWGMLKIRYEF